MEPSHSSVACAQRLETSGPLWALLCTHYCSPLSWSDPEIALLGYGAAARWPPPDLAEQRGSAEAVVAVSLRHSVRPARQLMTATTCGVHPPHRCRFDFCNPSRDWRASLAGMGHIWSPGKDADILYLCGRSHANDAMQIITDICKSTFMEIRPNTHITVGGGVDLFDYIVDVCFWAARGGGASRISLSLPRDMVHTSTQMQIAMSS